MNDLGTYTTPYGIRGRQLATNCGYSHSISGAYKIGPPVVNMGNLFWFTLYIWTPHVGEAVYHLFIVNCWFDFLLIWHVWNSIYLAVNHVCIITCIINDMLFSTILSFVVLLKKCTLQNALFEYYFDYATLGSLREASFQLFSFWRQWMWEN